MVPFLPPADVSIKLIDRLEVTCLDQALCQAQGHGRVVGPLARCEAEGTATEHVVDGREGAWGLELERRPQGVADGESEERAAGASKGVVQRTVIVRRQRLLAVRVCYHT